MIAKYMGERTVVFNNFGNELELKHGEEYDVKSEVNPEDGSINMIIFKPTNNNDEERFIIRYNDPNDIVGIWKMVINDPKKKEEENDTKSIGALFTATYIGKDHSVKDTVDLVNNNEYVIHISYKFPAINLRVYSDDSSADIMYLNTKILTRNWLIPSDFEDVIDQIEQDMKKHHIGQQQYIYGNKSRLELLESSMKDKSFNVNHYIEGFDNDNIASDNILIDPTWLKVIVYDLIEKQLKSYDEDELEFIACCESDTELANYVRGLIDLADSIIKKDDKSIGERIGE